MSVYDVIRAEGGRGETMNNLKDQQRSLNMRLLLALQAHDETGQTELTAQLEELGERIRRLGLK